MAKAAPKLPRWDLGELFAGPDDPKLDAALEALVAEAAAFEAEHQGALAAGPSAVALQRALDEYEALSRRAYRPMAYAQLLFSSDTQNPAYGALLQRVREAISAANVHLVFFELALGRLPAALGEAAELAPYRHHLEQARRRARHQLGEAEERILVETANVRGPAFVRLFNELQGRALYHVERDGGCQTLPQSEALALLREPERDVRRRAAAALTQGFKHNAPLVTFIYNTLIHEHAVLDRLRGFKRPEDARHLDNDLPPAAVEAMVDACQAHQGAVAEHYETKRRLLGLKSLDHADRYAPVGAPAAKIPFDRAREIVLDAFSRFDPCMAEAVAPFFERGWIDAAPARGKSGGAYCAAVTPDHHPYVFMNYTGTLDDVMTLAHELGHALHGVLARERHMLDFRPALPLAETASTFAEMLVFDHLLAGLDRREDQLALLCGKVENLIATVFRQVAIFRFEREAHARRRDRGELPAEAFNELWQSTQQALYGDSLRLGQDHAWWWGYIPHLMQSPFYVYAYAFGELLVLSLYARYQQEGAGFVENYVKLLAAGGSRPPAELVAELGFDVEDPDFWAAGCRLIAARVAQARDLAD